MFNGHDALLREEGLGVVVNELTVDETVDAVRGNFCHLGLHLLLLAVLCVRLSSNVEYRETDLLCALQLSKLAGALDLHFGAINLDLVGVHGCKKKRSACNTSQTLKQKLERTGVGDHNLGIVEGFGAIRGDALVENEACERSQSKRCVCSLPVCSRARLTFVEVRIRQLAADLFDDLDVVEVC